MPAKRSKGLSKEVLHGIEQLNEIANEHYRELVKGIFVYAAQNPRALDVLKELSTHELPELLLTRIVSHRKIGSRDYPEKSSEAKVVIDHLVALDAISIGSCKGSDWYKLTDVGKDAYKVYSDVKRKVAASEGEERAVELMAQTSL